MSDNPIKPQEAIYNSIEVLCLIFNRHFSEKLALVWSKYTSELTDQEIKDTTDKWALSQNSFPTIFEFKKIAKHHREFDSAPDDPSPPLPSSSHNDSKIALSKLLKCYKKSS